MKTKQKRFQVEKGCNTSRRIQQQVDRLEQEDRFKNESERVCRDCNFLFLFDFLITYKCETGYFIVLLGTRYTFTLKRS